MNAEGVSIHGLEVQNATGFGPLGPNSGFFVTGDGNTLSGNTARDNQAGFIVIGGNGNTLSDNTARDNNVEGFLLRGSVDNTLSNNTARDNRFGFVAVLTFVPGVGLVTSDRNTFIENTARGHNAHGFFVLVGTDNAFYRNASQNNQVGFLVGDNTGTTLTDNAARENLSNGFQVLGSTGTTLVGNIARENGGNGFVLAGGSDNALTGNIARSSLNSSTSFLLALFGE